MIVKYLTWRAVFHKTGEIIEQKCGLEDKESFAHNREKFIKRARYLYGEKFSLKKDVEVYLYKEEDVI